MSPDHTVMDVGACPCCLGAAGSLDGARILTINRGSSTVKCSLFTAGESPTRLLSGEVDRIGRSDGVWKIADLAGNKQTGLVGASDRVASVFELIDRLIGEEDPDAFGHRVVHGGSQHHEPCRVTPELVTDLQHISPFAPEHLPVQVELIEAIGRRWPTVPQIACFDTAFHHDMPRVARTLPIPREFEKLGIRRYGFHGLSYAYLMEELARVAGGNAARGRIVLAHLGNGASMAAIRNGQSIDTSMAFSPTAGFPMGTRSGDVDPGLIWFLGAVQGMTTDQFYEMVNRRSGLLGVSETSADMRELLAKEASDHRAAEAIDLFCYQVKKWIGGFVAAIGGLDTLVFSGGIGENAVEVRSRICANLECLGICLDGTRNAVSAAVISVDSSPVTVRVIHTDEEMMIARSALRFLPNH
jgi:acetate kinase